jgi:SAM-dependent methyltransferase
MRAEPAPHTREFITDVNARYHDAISPEYDRRLEGWHPDVLAHRQWIFDTYIRPRLTGVDRPRCIDFGCGSGYLEQFLEKWPPVDLIGIDVSMSMLKRAAGQFPSGKFFLADLYNYPFSHPFDLTMENAVLHHLKDYEALIERMVGLTKPGGVIFIGNEPNRLAYRYLAPLKAAFRKTVNRHRSEVAEERLGTAEFEALSEYHLFFNSGFSPFFIKRKLLHLGCTRVFLFFSLRELFAAVEEAVPRLKLNSLVPDFLRDHFLLSRNFSLVAWR